MKIDFARDFYFFKSVSISAIFDVTVFTDVATGFI